MRKKSLLLILVVMIFLLAGCGSQGAMETTVGMAEKTETIQVGLHTYEAVCLGEIDLSKVSVEYVCRTFWRLESAYEDFEGYPAQEKSLAYSDYPVEVEQGQVFVVDSTMADGSVVREYYRSNGASVQGMLVTEQFSVDPVVMMGEIEYKASYLGKVDLTGLSTEYQSYEFWRVEDAYEDVKEFPDGKNVLPYKDYPAKVEQGQVFAVDYTLTDGSVARKYYRSNGSTRDGMLVTEELLVLDGDTIFVGGKAYKAEYLGKDDLRQWFPHFQYREFWHLMDAYEDFKDCPLVGDNLPSGDYPAELEQYQVYVIDYTRTDGIVERQYLRSDGNTWNDMILTNRFVAPEPQKMEAGGKEYDAYFLGFEMLDGFKNYRYREFWRLDGAYEDFRDFKKTGNVLPCKDYPFEEAQQGQVYIIEYTTTAGTIEREFHRTDGNTWNNMVVSEEVTVTAPPEPCKIEVGGKEYDALYYGKKDMSEEFPQFLYWEYWKVEDAYEDCKDYRIGNGNIPTQDLPMEAEQGQVYVIDFTYTNGETVRQYFRTDGRVARSMERADQFYPGNPLKTDTIEIGGKEYMACYYGRKDFPFPDILYMDFWWVEDAYEDCKDYPKVRNDLPFPDFIMDVARGEVYVIDFTAPDGTVERKLYRTDGNFWRNMEVADEFVLEELKP